MLREKYDINKKDAEAAACRPPLLTKPSGDKRFGDPRSHLEIQQCPPGAGHLQPCPAGAGAAPCRRMSRLLGKYYTLPDRV